MHLVHPLVWEPLKGQWILDLQTQTQVQMNANVAPMCKMQSFAKMSAITAVYGDNISDVLMLCIKKLY